MRRRLIIAAAITLVAIIAAWLQLPHKSSAAAIHESKTIASLRGEHHQITITTGPVGPMYSVIRGGATVADRVSLEQLRLIDPHAHQQINTATADHGAALLADLD